jgi:hypothetical protein
MPDRYRSQAASPQARDTNRTWLTDRFVQFQIRPVMTRLLHHFTIGRPRACSSSSALFQKSC